MPAPSDAGKYLRAVATYIDDKENPEDNPATMDVDESKDTAMAVSAVVLGIHDGERSARLQER